MVGEFLQTRVVHKTAYWGTIEIGSHHKNSRLFLTRGVATSSYPRQIVLKLAAFRMPNMHLMLLRSLEK